MGNSSSADDLWEETSSCEACGTVESRPAWTICGRRFVTCLGCGVSRLHDRVAEHRLDLLYGSYYSDDDPTPAALDAALRNPTFRLRRTRLAAHLGARGRRLLEVGCGDGNFLAFMQRSGWTVRGSEFGADSADRVRRRHGIDVYVGPIEQLSPTPPFPVVAAYHVLEHVYHPARWLRQVQALIEPRGLLHLQVPNAGSLTRRLAGRSWVSMVFPEHVYFYTPTTLSALLERAGVSVVAVSTWDPWHGPGGVAGSVANVINSWTTGTSPWSDRLDEGTRRVMAAAPVGTPGSLRSRLRGLLDAASRPLSRVEAALGRGAVVDIIAERGEPGTP